MELNQLRYFNELAKTRNFTRAAKNCHVAQPALSQQIKRLETLLGVRLVRRMPRGAALTSEGELLLPYLRSVLNAVQEAENVAADLRGASRGVVRIVSLPSACVYVLPPKIAAFKRDHPRIDIVLDEKISDIHQPLLDGLCELGVTQSDQDVPGLSRALIHEEELLLAVPEGHRLAVKGEAALSEAADEPFVVTKPETEFRRLVGELCRRAGFAVKATFEADHFDSLQAYCAVGMGVAIIPNSVVLKGLAPAPRYLRITAPEARRKLWLLWPQRRLKNKAAEILIPYLLRRPAE